MNTRIHLTTVCILLTASCVAYSGIVDLSPDEKGDRIAVVKDGKVAYLPAKRANIGSGVVGGGACRYIKCSKNGDLYVTGPWLGLFCSKDGGNTWSSSPLNVPGLGFIGAFTILRNDDFLIAYSGGAEASIARSTDYGQTWKVGKMDGDISPYNRIVMDNGDLLELANGNVLMTCNLRYRMDVADDLEPYLNGAFPHVFHSYDGGKTWPGRSIITMYGAETHLLQLPSGEVMACIRKQRWHRLPGDPSSVLETKKRYGYSQEFGGGLVEDTEDANRVKNMFVSSSYDGGYTWVNEQQASGFMQCSGDMSYLEDGTLVLQYLHRYKGGPVADVSVRARVSYDHGKTWEPEEYILSDGENYPGGIAMPDGGMISMCPHKGQIQAVHWRPLPKDKPTLAYESGSARAAPASRLAPSYDPDAGISVIVDGKTTQRPATRVDILPVMPGAKHSAIRYGRNSSIIQRSPSGDLYCAGNILGPYMMTSQDDGKTWQRMELDIQGWGEMIGFRILRNGDFVIAYEPVGGGQRNFYAARSTDEGKTWSVTMGNANVAPFKHISGKDNNLIELDDGTLVVAVQFWGGRDESGAKAAGTEDMGGAYTLRSTDGGANWSQRASICGLAGKARLVSLQSGKLLACVQSIKPGPYKTFYIAESGDGGVTWINPREALAGHNPTTAGMLQLADGRVLLQFLRDAQPGKSPHASWYAGCGMRAVISDDEGKTWQDPLYVVSRIYADGQEPSGFGAYLGDTVEMADGTLLTTCTGAVGPGNRFTAMIWKP